MFKKLFFYEVGLWFCLYSTSSSSLLLVGASNQLIIYLFLSLTHECCLLLADITQPRIYVTVAPPTSLSLSGNE